MDRIDEILKEIKRGTILIWIISCISVMILVFSLVIAVSAEGRIKAHFTRQLKSLPCFTDELHIEADTISVYTNMRFENEKR